MKKKIVTVKDIKIGANSPIVLVAGPCVIESAESAMDHASAIKDIAQKRGVPFIFKASYDKANRSSVGAYRGPGIKKGLDILRRIKEALDVPVLSDVHSVEEIKEAGDLLDVIQIPAFLCRQTDLLLAAAETGKVVNVKKGQFMSPGEMNNVVVKIESAGNNNILLTERGTTFGYNMLVNDFRAIPIMGETGYPVVYDATHSVQMPGGLGTASGGQSHYVQALSKAAVAIGCDALFVEVHKDPDKAKSDGPNMLKLSELDEYLVQIKKIEKAVR